MVKNDCLHRRFWEHANILCQFIAQRTGHRQPRIVLILAPHAHNPYGFAILDALPNRAIIPFNSGLFFRHLRFVFNCQLYHFNIFRPQLCTVQNCLRNRKHKCPRITGVCTNYAVPHRDYGSQRRTGGKSVEWLAVHFVVCFEESPFENSRNLSDEIRRLHDVHPDVFRQNLFYGLRHMMAVVAVAICNNEQF